MILYGLRADVQPASYHGGRVPLGNQGHYFSFPGGQPVGPGGGAEVWLSNEAFTETQDPLAGGGTPRGVEQFLATGVFVQAAIRPGEEAGQQILRVVEGCLDEDVGSLRQASRPSVSPAVSRLRITSSGRVSSTSRVASSPLPHSPTTLASAASFSISLSPRRAAG